LRDDERTNYSGNFDDDEGSYAAVILLRCIHSIEERLTLTWRTSCGPNTRTLCLTGRSKPGMNAGRVIVPEKWRLANG
jgi:hypothetical protein